MRHLLWIISLLLIPFAILCFINANKISEKKSKTMSGMKILEDMRKQKDMVDWIIDRKKGEELLEWAHASGPPEIERLEKRFKSLVVRGAIALILGILSLTAFVLIVRRKSKHKLIKNNTDNR